MQIDSSLSRCLQEFALTRPQLVDETQIATVWRCTRSDGQPVALKLYKDAQMHNEAAGFELLLCWQGEAAAKLLGRMINDDIAAAVIEWLEGPSLGDLCRTGQDELSNRILVDVASRLHRVSGYDKARLTTLEDTVGDLLSVSIPADWSSQSQDDIALCQRLAQQLLDSQTMICALHGDLHHDNVRRGERGFSAFDAKGLVGDKTYELANAFRNPKGMEDAVIDRGRIERLATLFAKDFNVDRGRLLRWAAVKCALSIVWRGSDVTSRDREFELLSILLKASAAASGAIADRVD